MAKVSPYKRYGKRPYRYSDAYREWFNAIIKGSDAHIVDKARQRHNNFVKNRLATG